MFFGERTVDEIVQRAEEEEEEEYGQSPDVTAAMAAAQEIVAAGGPHTIEARSAGRDINTQSNRLPFRRVYLHNTSSDLPDGHCPREVGRAGTRESCRIAPSNWRNDEEPEHPALVDSRLTMGAGIFVVITGLLMFFVTESPFKFAHELVGIGFSVAVVLHVLTHWRSFSTYFAQRRAVGVLALAWSAGIGLVLASAILGTGEPEELILKRSTGLRSVSSHRSSAWT